MNSTAAKSPPAGTVPGIPPGGGPTDGDAWTRSRWLMLIALIFAAHVALLFAFGERKQIIPTVVTKVPVLHLANETDEELALNDPTLFALPHRGDFASVIREQTPVLKQPSFHRAAPAGWLPLSGEELGTVFNEFMQTNRFARPELQLKPPLKLSTPGLPVEPVLARTSTLQLEGGLASRRLLTPLTLADRPYPDVMAPSIVQVVVDAAGNVVSAVLLPSDNPLEAASRYDNADQDALELARTARFAPAPRLTLGRLIFNWHTVSVPAANPPVNP